MWDELWIDDEFYKITEKLINKIYRINSNGKVVPMMKSQNIITPWVHVNNHLNTDRYCSIWMDIYFKHYHIYPDYCKNKCFKVVAYPRNCKETFDLYELMKQCKLHCKIGIDLRDYTPSKVSNFSAFFYCNNQEHGQEVYEQVKEMASKVHPDTPVLLKRSCTEMELDKTLEPNPDWEQRLDNIFEKDELFWVEPEFVRNRTKVFWLKYARSVGDTSYREVHELPADKGKYQLFHKETD